MIITAGNSTLHAIGVLQTRGGVNGVMCECIQLMLESDPTDAQLVDLMAGTIQTDDGREFAGYTGLANVQLTLYRPAKDAKDLAMQQAIVQITRLTEAEQAARKEQAQAVAAKEQAEEAARMAQEQVTAQRTMLDSIMAGLTDDQALKTPSIYPLWQTLIGKRVETGQRLRYAEHLHRVDEAHVVEEELYPGAKGAERRYSKVLPTAPHADPPTQEGVESWAATGVYDNIWKEVT